MLPPVDARLHHCVSAFTSPPCNLSPPRNSRLSRVFLFSFYHIAATWHCLFLTFTAILLAGAAGSCAVSAPQAHDGTFQDQQDDDPVGDRLSILSVRNHHRYEVATLTLNVSR